MFLAIYSTYSCSKILDKIRPLLGKEDADQIETYEKKIKKTNGLVKHWYRTQGSRKKYTNERPSFWTITGHTTPWSFLKKDRKGYKVFKETLQNMKQEDNPTIIYFYANWHHLLKREPTKTDQGLPSKEGKEQSAIDSGTSKLEQPKDELFSRQRSVSSSTKERKHLLYIFPHPGNSTYGLDILMKAANISAEDLQMIQQIQRCSLQK